MEAIVSLLVLLLFVVLGVLFALSILGMVVGFGMMLAALFGFLSCLGSRDDHDPVRYG